MSNLQPTNICILRLSAIGDCCHVVALVQHIYKHLPDSKVTWVIGKLEARLMRAILPQVTFIEFDKSLGIKAYFQLRKQLKQQEFDYLLHLQPNMRANLASLAIKAKVKVGYHSSRSRELQSLFVNHQAPLGEGVHVAESFMDFAAVLGLPVDKPSWQVSPPVAEFSWVTDYLSDLKKLTSRMPLVLLCPSASNPERNWQTEKYIELINYLHQKNIFVILIGSPAQNEIDLAREIQKSTEKRPTNLAGKTDLIQLLALIQRADLLIAPDTGPAHMATLVNTPVIGLYAAQTPERTGPYNDLDKVISVYDEALLAETGKTTAQVSWRTRVKATDAMERISLESVIRAVNTWQRNLPH